MADFYRPSYGAGPGLGAFVDGPRNGPYSSFPGGDYERPNNFQSWNEPQHSGPFSSNPYDGHQQFGGPPRNNFDGPPRGNYNGQSFGGPFSGGYGGGQSGDNYNGPPFGGGPPGGFNGPPFGGGSPGGPYGGPYGDCYARQSMGWNGGPGPAVARQGAFGDDTWRSQTNDTWRGDRPSHFESGRRNESSRSYQRNRSPSFHADRRLSERTYQRKSDTQKREESRRHHDLQDSRSRQSSVIDSGERHRSSPRTAERLSSKDGAHNEGKKIEIKKEETGSNAELKEHRIDEVERDISRQKEEKHDSKQTETVKVSGAENQETNEKRSDVSKGNSDSPKKGDESGKDLRIRTDFTHDDIHHFKPLALKNRRDEHQKPADTTNQKEEFRKFIETAVKQKPTNSSNKSTERCVPSSVVRDGSSPQRIRSPVLDPQKYVEELSNPDTDPPQLCELEGELLPKKIMPARSEFMGHKKPLISDRPFQSRNTGAPPVSCADDSFGGFFSGPVNAGPSKMHVKRRTLVPSPPPIMYAEPERPYKPGLLDGPPSKRMYEDPYCAPPQSPQRPMKPGLLDGPTVELSGEEVAPRTQERPRNGPVANPTISAVAESITAVATSLAPPEIIAAVTEKGLADELLSNENLKAKIKEVYTEEIQKMLAKKSKIQSKYMAEPEKLRPLGDYREESLRKSLSRLSGSAELGKEDYDSGPYSAEQTGSSQRSVQFFKYSGPEWRTKREERFADDSQKPMKMVDSPYRNDDPKHYSGPSCQEYGSYEQEHYGRGPGPNRCAPPMNYDGERCGPPSDRYSGRTQERYCGPPPDQCIAPLDRYNGHSSDHYSGPTDNYSYNGLASDYYNGLDRYSGPSDRYGRPPSNYGGSYGISNEPESNFSSRGYDGPRNFGGTHRSHY